jgi:hypothetical protein
LYRSVLEDYPARFIHDTTEKFYGQDKNVSVADKIPGRDETVLE